MKEGFKYALAITTPLLIVTLAFIIIWYENPRTIEHNNTIIKEIEKIVEVEKECPECIIPICPSCNESIKCNESECPYSRDYVLGLIRIAKKCERRDTFDVDECVWKLNKTTERLTNCTDELDNCKSDCLVYCDDIEYERDQFEDKFNNCTANYNECEADFETCKNDLDKCD